MDTGLKIGGHESEQSPVPVVGPPAASSQRHDPAAVVPEPPAVSLGVDRYGSLSLIRLDPSTAAAENQVAVWVSSWITDGARASQLWQAAVWKPAQNAACMGIRTSVLNVARTGRLSAQE